MSAYPLCCASGEERKHQGERANEQSWQGIDDADLFEDLAGVVKRGKETNMSIANVCGVVHKQVGKSVREAPAKVRGSKERVVAQLVRVR